MSKLMDWREPLKDELFRAARVVEQMNPGIAATMLEASDALASAQKLFESQYAEIERLKSLVSRLPLDRESPFGGPPEYVHVDKAAFLALQEAVAEGE